MSLEYSQIQSFIDGRWVTGTGSVVTSVCPAAPDRVVAQGPAAGLAELDEAAAAARAAQPRWAALALHERGAVLSRAAAVLDGNAQAWGVELAAEEGKTKAEGIGEVQRAAQILRYYGNEGDRQSGEMFSSPRRGEHILVTRKPLGVVGVITPFNFPIAIPAWKIGPALVYGNAVLWKPAGTVPLLAMRLAQAFDAAGLPAGVLNLIVADSGVGDAMVGDTRVDAITFTGSTGVGRRIAAAGAARGIPVQAEMGGKNAAVVLDDADIDLAVAQVLLGAFRSTGQKCTATSRLVLTEGIADTFLSRLTERADALIVGDPTMDDTQMGPVVSESAFGTISAGISRAVAQGATTIAGGHGYAEGPLATGYFIAPTIMELGTGAEDLWIEELFGPVLAVRRAADTEEAFRLANDSEFGLSAAIFTKDLTQALRAVDHLDVGILHVNSESAGADPHVPFGGAKKSGLGPKEQGRAAREFFTHTTTVYLRGGEAV